MKAMILAAGKGERLSRLHKKWPKVLFPVSGRPLLEHNLRYLKRQGISQVAINLHEQADQISDFLRGQRSLGMDIRLSYETKLLGTAGALSQLIPFFEKTDFFVLYGDNLLDFNLKQFARNHRSSGRVMTLGVFHPDKTYFSGVAAGLIQCRKDNSVKEFRERRGGREIPSGSWVNAGAMMCSPEILKEIPAGKYCDFAKDLYPKLLKKNQRLGVYTGASYVLASDTPEAWKQTCLLAKKLIRGI